MFSIIKGPLKQKLATKYYRFLNLIVFENLCSIYSFKKLLNPEKVGNIEKFRKKKVLAPIAIPKLDPGFHSRNRNLVSVVHYMHIHVATHTLEKMKRPSEI